MQAIVICIGTDRHNGVRARLSLIHYDDDGEELSEQYHSVALMPGDDTNQARKAVEDHIGTKRGGVAGAPWPTIPDKEWSKVELMCKLLHTPELIAARQVVLDAEAAAKEPAD
jgi:hypothetical protein